ncbi:unnamed protein product, partial [Larinioides sclopetarius]
PTLDPRGPACRWKGSPTSCDSVPSITLTTASAGPKSSSRTARHYTNWRGSDRKAYTTWRRSSRRCSGAG